MKILALETSHLPGAMALLEDEHMIAERGLPSDVRTSQSFARVGQELLRQVGWRARDVEMVAVTRGPGSFTGLRIGMTAAKMWAYVSSCPVVAIDTMEVIAAQSPAAWDLVWVALDGQRRQLYVRCWQRNATNWPTPVTDGQMVEVAELADRCEFSRPWTGAGLSLLQGRYPEGMRVASNDLWTPQASTLGRLAWRHHTHGERDDMWSLVPTYHRPSAAEERAAERPV